MVLDDSKLNYSSSWDIDQLVVSNDTSATTFTNRVVVPIGTTLISTVPTGLPDIPEFDVQFQIANLTRWYYPGSYSTNGTVAGLHAFSVFLQNRGIYITTDIAGTAKYFIWADKVNY